MKSSAAHPVVAFPLTSRTPLFHLPPMPSDDDKFDLDDLLATLSVAQSLATELASDPLIPRFLRVLQKIPRADREVIIGVLERDATWCRIVDQTGDSTGITVRANPHASL